MMGKRIFAPKLYYQLSLDDLVPKNHLLRQISAAIDFSFVYPLTKSHYSYTGQPSVDPVVIFKTMLIGYLFGITSERRLMNEIQVNLAYRWFLGYDIDEEIPDHSVLTKARCRFGADVFEKFFEQSIQVCAKVGLLTEGPVYVDSTHVAAAASLESLVRRGDALNPPYTPKEFVKKLSSDNPAPEASPNTNCVSENGNETANAQGSDFLARGKHEGRTNDNYVSRTDPDATVVNTARLGLRLAYKAHLSVSGKDAAVVTAAIVTTGIVGEEHLLGDVLESHSKHTGLVVKQAVADTRYGMLANYESLEKAGIEAYIPPHERNNGVNGYWGKEHFQYVPEQDVYICPAKRTLAVFRVTTIRGKRYLLYRCERGVCQNCPLHSRCTPPGNPRTLTRSLNQDLIERAKDRLSTPIGQRIFGQRKTRIEGIFALGKELHGLRRTRLMGKWKVQIQVWLTATVINLKRAARAMALLPVASKFVAEIGFSLFSLEQFRLIVSLAR